MNWYIYVVILIFCYFSCVDSCGLHYCERWTEEGRGWGFKTGFPVGEGEGQKLVQYCNQWPAMLDFESMFDIGFQVLKYYFLCKRFIWRKCFFIGEIGSIGCQRWVCWIIWRLVFVLCFTSLYVLISFRWAWEWKFFNKVVWRVRVVILRMEGTCDCVFHVYIGTLGLF